MNYKACYRCEHLKGEPCEGGFVLFCDLLSPLIRYRPNYVKKHTDFSLDEIALGTYRDALIGVSKYNKAFVPPEECEYLLEHTVNKEHA